jgi:hypothetical protein
MAPAESVPGARPGGSALWAALLCAAIAASGCHGTLVREYEYDEQVDLSLDGSAVIYVNASIPALVALRGADFDLDPGARMDRTRVRALYERPGVRVAALSSYRRHGRRFVSLRLGVDDIRQVSQVPGLSWSRYQLERSADAYTFTQDVGAAPGRPVGDVGWAGDEMVAFRLHLPSRIRFHNAGTGNFRRGNLLVWEQSLRERLAGNPLHMEARMDTQSILNRTLWLFAGTFAAAMATLATIVWWVRRRGTKTSARPG